jgi:hypothetical protein
MDPFEHLEIDRRIGREKVRRLAADKTLGPHRGG